MRIAKWPSRNVVSQPAVYKSAHLPEHLPVMVSCFNSCQCCEKCQFIVLFFKLIFLVSLNIFYLFPAHFTFVFFFLHLFPLTFSIDVLICVFLNHFNKNNSDKNNKHLSTIYVKNLSLTIFFQIQIVTLFDIRILKCLCN